MDGQNLSADALQEQISATEKKLAELKEQLRKIEDTDKAEAQPDATSTAAGSEKWPLTPEEYNRYGRQMIVPSIGLKGQLRLHAASVLIIGAGGLGCPAAAYIAASGVKTLGIVDGDTVEVSNLHRQILHNTETVDMFKVDSVIQYLKRLNPNVEYNGYPEHLTPENALAVVSKYDIVLDCTDHPKSRYLISDVCILLNKPLVSASALKTDGQLIILNYPPRPAGDPSGGPCYRCVFPKPPPADQLVSCGDGGILGPVVGAMGVLQAVETIKLIVAGISIEDTTIPEFENNKSLPPTFLIYSGMSSSSPFRSIKLRSRRLDCFACSTKASLGLESLTLGLLDYVAFCGLVNPVKLLSPEERISAQKYAELERGVGKDHILVDVREKVQFDICSLEGSINVPFSKIQGSRPLPDTPWLDSVSKDTPIYIVCRLGNDSQIATKKFKESGLDEGGARYIGDIEGGLKSWRETVDSSWPDY